MDTIELALNQIVPEPMLKSSPSSWQEAREHDKSGSTTC